ncbi:hypothetical protein BS78_10G190000 [Paspalum vaginatum]|nr:hypothetical protein BS78_10G190000 [Paspalum vaginatum]
MGLAGGIVRRVFSRSPCSSASGRGHHSKGSADHRRRWSSLRLYLCGEEMHAAPEEEEEDETVSVKSFETCVVTMPPEAHAPAAQPSDVRDAVENDTPWEEPQDQGVPAGEEGAAATLIQSAFRGFMARRQVQELRTARKGTADDAAGEPRSPTSASLATSVVVQVGESLSNLRLSEDSASVQQRASHSQRSRPPPPPAFRAKEEWDDSTVSSNVSRMRIQSRIEATTRRERALAYAFSQQLRSSGGATKKRSARPDQAEFNVGWSWLERWMATRQAEPADDCMSRNADTGSATAGRRVVVVRRRSDLAVEEKESCGSNDVSVVSFDGSSLGGRSGLSCHKPGRSRIKGARNLPRRKQVASSDHRVQSRSHKVSKKGHQRQEQAPPHKDEPETDGFDHACQPPTDY